MICLNSSSFFRELFPENVRSFTENGETYFCASDVAGFLGYRNPQDAVSRHCRRSFKRLSPAGTGRQIFISESDVTRLIVRSRMPAAVLLRNRLEKESRKMPRTFPSGREKLP